MDADAAGTLAKSALPEWIARLLAVAEVIAPARADGGDVLFTSIASPDQVLWEFDNPLLPPKAFALPQVEALVRIRRGAGGLSAEPVSDERPRVLLNVRSCDAKGLAFLRGIFASEPADQAYLRRSDQLALVSLACSTPCALGFCVCCDAGPFLEDGFALQLTDLGDRLLAEPGSERGRELLALAGPLLRPVRKGERARRRELEEQARRRLGTQTCHFASAMRRISTGRVPQALWQQMSDWCLECGACNHLCPTCYCFSLADRPTEDGWLRCRLWDSCQYAAFTLEASGHNPRECGAERLKRRFFHKASAQYYQRDGAVGCVGCGRCIKACLGATDMPAVVAAVRGGSWRG
jgi:ferredoxin